MSFYDILTIAELNAVVPYSPTARLQNARMLTGDRAARVLTWLNTYEEPDLSPETLETLGEILGDDTRDLDAEGAVLYRKQQLRERSESNRLRVLERKTFVCEVCGYNFAEQFKGFAATANVHHKNPLALGERRAETIDDFAVLCAPCHTAAHMGPGRKLNPWSIEDLRGLIRKRWDA